VRWSFGRFAFLAVLLWAAAATAAFAAGKDAFFWKLGDDTHGYVGASSDTGAVDVFAPQDFNVVAGHVRFVSVDGNYELEHPQDRPYSRLLAYDTTATRTPIMIGADDGQDVVPLMVDGTSGQSSDLQQWVESGKVVSAIDANGDLRVGNVTLASRVVHGKAELLAILPNRTTQVLAAAK